MDVIKKSVKQTERIKKQATTGFKTDLSLEETAVRRIVAPFVKCRVAGVSKIGVGAEVAARAYITVLYEGDSGLETYESAVDFIVQIPFDGEYLHEPEVTLFADSVKISASAGGYGLAAEITATAEFLTARELYYVGEIEGAICKKAAFSAIEYKTSCVDNYELEEQKTFNYLIKRLLCANEGVRVISVQCGVESLIFDAEAGGEFLFLTDGGDLVRESAWFPLRFEVAAEGVSPDMQATGVACVCDAAYKIESSEQDGSSVITLNYLLRFFGEAYAQTECERVEDCFCLNAETTISRESAFCECGRELLTFKGKALGEAACERDGTIKGVISACVYGLNSSVFDGKITFSGVIKAEVLTENADGVIKRAVCELPVSLDFSARYGEACSACAVVKNVSVKEFDGKCVLEGDLIFAAVCADAKTENLVAAVSLGEEKPLDDCAVSMIFVKKGDDAWAVCKKAGVSERLLKQQNPSVEFPAESDGVISVYRKIDI